MTTAGRFEVLGDEVRPSAGGDPVGQVAYDPPVAERREDPGLALEIPLGAVGRLGLLLRVLATLPVRW